MTFKIDTTPPVNELQFVEPDIRQAFQNSMFLVGMPTLVQLNRNLARLVALLEKGNAESDRGTEGRSP